MQSALPMTVLGIEAGKGGHDQKEPIYKVKASFCRGYALCFLFAVMLAGALFFYEDPEDARRVFTPAINAAVRAKRAAQHLGHFRATRLGQELERHLEHDIAEKEWALLARARLTRLEQGWRDEVSRAAARAGESADDDKCASVADAVRDDLLKASDRMWSELRQTLSLLDALVDRGGKAEDQHDAVHREVAEELRRDSEERSAFAEHVEKHGEDARYADLDDAARTELLDADAWRRDLVDRFLQNYDSFAGENAQLTLTTPSTLTSSLDKLEAALEGDASTTWRAAEAKLAKLAPQLAAAGAPAYEPNAPSTDDALDYVQAHNVLEYLNEVSWRAKLTASRSELDADRRAYEAKELTPMAFVERLEELEGRGAFPSDWLYSSGVDDLAFADVVET
jgi:hypothetical protein